MHLAVEHSTIFHFADDTNLLYSCKPLKTLRKAINMVLQLLYEWLWANWLSLDAGKTEFIVFRPVGNKIKGQPTLKLQHTKLFESSKIKYLGLILDNKLNWKAHINCLIYKIRHMRPTAVVRSLYYSLFHSHLSYGLVVWGNANKSYIDKIRSLQKRALKSIVFANNDNTVNTNRIYFDLKVLNIDHQFQVQLSSLMWDYDHDTLPSSLKGHFKRANFVRNYSTRAASKERLHYCKVQTYKHGIKSFKCQDIKILNDLKKMDIHQNTNRKCNFLKELKLDLLSSY